MFILGNRKNSHNRLSNSPPDGSSRSKFVREVPFEELGIDVADMNTVMLQYWGCAQGRILGVAEAVLRMAPEPIPLHLKLNKNIRAQVDKAFAQAHVPWRLLG